MLPYKAGTFVDVFKTELGQQLWSYLNAEDAVACMEMAAQRGRPPVEALTPALLAAFGDQVRPKRVRQTIGNMIRQIMEPRGYQPEPRGTKILGGRNQLFSDGTRYIPPQA